MSQRVKLDNDLFTILQAFQSYQKGGILAVELLLSNEQKIRQLEEEVQAELIAEFLGEQT